SVPAARAASTTHPERAPTARAALLVRAGTARPWPPASAAPERVGAAERLAEPAGPWAAREVSGPAQPWARGERRRSSAPAPRALSGPARPALPEAATDCQAALSPQACREPCRRGAAPRA